MNLNQLREELSAPAALLPLGRTVELEGVLCHLAGLCLAQSRLSLLALVYDPDFPPEGEPPPCQPRPCTNRERLLGSLLRPAPRLPSIRELQVGTQRWQSTQSSGEGAANRPGLLCRLLWEGWDPGELGWYELDRLTLLQVELEGDCPSLPALEPQAPIQLGLGWWSQAFPVQLPLTLRCGRDYPRPLLIPNPEGGEPYLLQIHQVRLVDMREAMEETFSSPKIRQQHTPQQLDRLRREALESLAAICPPGMLFPVVEYQCREGSAEFYSQRWLDAPHQTRSRDWWFRVSPEQPTGELGLPMQCCVLQHPVPPDIRQLEGELLLFHRTTPPRTVEVTPPQAPPPPAGPEERQRLARRYRLFSPETGR